MHILTDLLKLAVPTRFSFTKNVLVIVTGTSSGHK